MLSKSSELCASSQHHATPWKYYNNGALEFDETFHIVEQCSFYSDFGATSQQVRKRQGLFYYYWFQLKRNYKGSRVCESIPTGDPASSASAAPRPPRDPPPGAVNAHDRTNLVGKQPPAAAAAATATASPATTSPSAAVVSSALVERHQEAGRVPRATPQGDGRKRRY